MQKLEEQNEHIGKSMKSMKARMKEMQIQQEQLQNMLQAVVEKLEITLEDDAPDEFEEESLFLHHVFE
jgi:predicted transcriptional regulator